jgi:hypothetical protein
MSSSVSEDYSDLEFEVIGLKVALDTIDSLVNRQMLDFLGSGKDVEIQFPTEPHQKLFYIILTDFLSRNTDISLMQSDVSCIEQLGKVVNRPLLEADRSAISLRNAHDVFSKWLEHEISTNVWASSLDMELPLQLSRQQVVYFAGNMSKHHFGHLTVVRKKINKLLENTNHPRHDLIPALESIYADLHDNILNYHGSTIAEMLNNIRWGIHDYLLPEFNRAYRKIDDVFYEFDVPKDIKTDFAKSCYWELMNSVRSKPYISKFTVNEILKLRY